MNKLHKLFPPIVVVNMNLITDKAINSKEKLLYMGLSYIGQNENPIMHTNNELRKYIDLNRSTISTYLNKLQKAGWIKIVHNKHTLTEPASREIYLLSDPTVNLFT